MQLPLASLRSSSLTAAFYQLVTDIGITGWAYVGSCFIASRPQVTVTAAVPFQLVATKLRVSVVPL